MPSGGAVLFPQALKMSVIIIVERGWMGCRRSKSNTYWRIEYAEKLKHKNRKRGFYYEKEFQIWYCCNGGNDRSKHGYEQPSTTFLPNIRTFL